MGTELTDHERAILRIVVQRYLADEAPTTRRDLLRTFKDEPAVDRVTRHSPALREIDRDTYFPMPYAFEHCGDADALKRGREAVQLVLHTLKRLEESNPKKGAVFTFEQVVEMARSLEGNLYLFGPVSVAVLKRGMYLAQFFGVLDVWAGDPADLTLVKSFSFADRIITIDPDRAWDENVQGQTILPQINFRNRTAFWSQPEAPALQSAVEAPQQAIQQQHEWDVFISHASEDKAEIADELAKELRNRGLRVWYDATLKVGDGLRRSIDHGLAHSRYGIVILSPHFFAKHWPQQELDGLASLEVEGRKVILPVWHSVGLKEVREYSPMLAGRLGVSTDTGLHNVIEELLRAINPSYQPVSEPTVRYDPPYFYKPDDPYPLCPKCWQGDKHKAVYLLPQEPWKGGLRRKCPVCDFVHFDKPPKPAPRIEVVRSRRWPILPEDY